MPYINEKEWDALHLAREQLSDLIERGAEDPFKTRLNEANEALHGLIEKVRTERSRHRIRSRARKIVEERRSMKTPNLSLDDIKRIAVTLSKKSGISYLTTRRRVEYYLLSPEKYPDQIKNIYSTYHQITKKS